MSAFKALFDEGFFGEARKTFHYGTDAEWDAAGALEIGAQHPEMEWVCTDRGAWHRNPSFTGTPSGRHPEDGE